MAASNSLPTARCNSKMIGDYASEVRGYDAHPPGSSLPDMEKRFNDINQVLQALSQERAVIDSVCSSDADKAPLFAYIGATASYALALGSDIALRINQPCPAGAKAVAQAMLAQGWLDLGMVVNDDNGKVPQDITEAAPRIETRATAVGLTLPKWADTSAYWRNQINDLAKGAVQACPTPSPAASPSP